MLYSTKLCIRKKTKLIGVSRWENYNSVLDGIKAVWG
jgi:hypothetical protein